jgi:CheY-like chemotaxis protein
MIDPLGQRGDRDARLRRIAIDETGAAPLRVVLVDDDARFRRSALRALAAEDVEVVEEVEDGTLAAAAVDRWHPDVVLVDIRMPGVDGLEVARRLQTHRDPPVVILISTIDSASGHQLAGGLAVGYLPKDALSRAAILDLIGPPRQPTG